LLGINKLVSATGGRCNKKKATATVATVVLALKSVHKLKGEGSLQCWTASIKSSIKSYDL